MRHTAIGRRFLRTCSPELLRTTEGAGFRQRLPAGRHQEQSGRDLTSREETMLGDVGFFTEEICGPKNSDLR